MVVDKEGKTLLMPSRGGWYWARWKNNETIKASWQVVHVMGDLFVEVLGLSENEPLSSFEWYAPAGTVEALEEPQ